MSKGSHPVKWNGEVHGHMVFVSGRGWVYRPLKSKPWIDVARCLVTGAR